MSVVIIPDAILSQNSLLCLLLSLSTKSGSESLILSTGNCSPITPVEAKIRSLIFTVSDVPDSDFDSLKVKILARFFLQYLIVLCHRQSSKYQAMVVFHQLIF